MSLFPRPRSSSILFVEVGLTFPARGIHFRNHDLGIVIHRHCSDRQPHLLYSVNCVSNIGRRAAIFVAPQFGYHHAAVGEAKVFAPRLTRMITPYHPLVGPCTSGSLSARNSFLVLIIYLQQCTAAYTQDGAHWGG